MKQYRELTNKQIKRIQAIKAELAKAQREAILIRMAGRVTN